MTDNGRTASVLDALVLIARRHGIETSAATVERQFVLNDPNLPVAALIGIAGELGLVARGLKVEWRDLPRFKGVLPAILRLRDGVGLVLEAIVEDPTSGRMAV